MASNNVVTRATKTPKDDLAELRDQRSLFAGLDAPLRLDEYQRFTTRTDRTAKAGIDGLGFHLLGVFGEVGSLLSALKKKQRDRDSFVAYRGSVIEELGDVLWYFTTTATRAGLELATIADRASAQLQDWDYNGRPRPTSFGELQKSKRLFEGPLASDLVERRLLAMAGKVGVLLENFSTKKIQGNRDVLSGDLVEIFRSLVAAADDADISLEDAAVRNVSKVLGRWPLVEDWGPLYDEEFDADEQLPRCLAMVFKEKEIDGKTYVIQQCNGLNIGDRLTDNKLEPDDYRFHDVFHLSFAAILGWSPTLRALLKVKRKSRPEVDENEDGARANILEEGISTWIFNHGVRNQDFRSVKSLDYGLLKAVHELVRGYEVESRPLWQWERAILEGFRVFRELRKHRRGTVIADLRTRSLRFERLP